MSVLAASRKEVCFLLSAALISPGVLPCFVYINDNKKKKILLFFPSPCFFLEEPTGRSGRICRSLPIWPEERRLENFWPNWSVLANHSTLCWAHWIPGNFGLGAFCQKKLTSTRTLPRVMTRHAGVQSFKC